MMIEPGVDVRPQRPYPGIEPFKLVDQRILAGRSDDVWNVLSSVLRFRASLLYGDSGSGKSSMVNAGLIPELLGRGYVVDRLRVRPRRGAEFAAERIETGLADTPYLASTFGSDRELSIEEFTTTLQSAMAAAGAPIPFLIFDQFEEAATLFEEQTRSSSVEEVAAVQRSIRDCLTRLMNDPGPRLKMLFVFRADCLAKLYPFFELSPEVFDQFVLLLPPPGSDLEEIIRAPFKDADLKNAFEQDRASLVESLSGTLAEEVARELRSRSDSGRANLSELQIVCRQLWDSPDGEKLFRSVGVQGLLERYLTEAIDSLGPSLRDAAIVILGHLVTASGTRNIVSYDDLRQSREPALSTDVLDAALKALAERRLIVGEQRRAVVFYEVSSEFLIPWIQEQQRTHLARVRELELRQRAEQELRRAKERATRVRNVGIAIALFAVAAIVGGFQMYRLRQQAIAAESRANTILQAMQHLQDDDAASRAKAITDIEALVKAKQLPRDLLPLILLSVANDTDPEVSRRARALLSSLSTLNGLDSEGAQLKIAKAAEQNPQLAPTLPPRLYIHIAQESQRTQADAIKQKLSGTFIVPGVQYVGTLSPRVSSVRYFRDAQQDRDRAGSVVSALSALGIMARPVYIRGYENSPTIRQGHFELWLAAPPSSEAAVADIPPPPAPTSTGAGSTVAGTAGSETGPLTEAVVEQRNARALEKLQPETARRARLLIDAAQQSGIIAVIVAGYRSDEEQAKLYAIGRFGDTRSAVTNSKGGGAHNLGVAFDLAPVVNGRVDLNNVDLFERLGAIGRTVGLSWGGDIKSFRDLPHFEYRPPAAASK